MKNTMFNSILKHACLMVGRTLKSYARLSVTIVLSFSFLLGYLLFTDANLYNQYRDVFSYRRGDVLIRDTSADGKKVEAFLENLKEIENTNCFVYCYSLGGTLEAYYTADDPSFLEGNTITLPNWQLYYLPDHAWLDGTLVSFFSRITWLEEPREDFYLAEDEVILCEGVFRALGLDRMENPAYTFRFEEGATMTLRIAGYTADEYPFKLNLAAVDGSVYLVDNNYTNQLILSSKLLDASILREQELMCLERYVAVYSDNPEQVVQLAETIEFNQVESIYAQQNDALEAIRYEKKNKAIIACALLLLLGINLYSSFSNALNDRKFEIGVKRAIGASGWSIVRQFLYESLIVMAVNTFLSVVLVTDGLIVYKYIFEHTPDEWGNYYEWVISVTPQSIAMFAVCALTLTIVFSLIFAYKSTRVEIVQYLKAE